VIRRGWQTTGFEGVLMVSWARALVAKTAATAREAKKDFMVVEGSVDDGGRTRGERVVTWKKTTGGKKRTTIKL
jgi:hypothetical protein